MGILKEILSAFIEIARISLPSIFALFIFNAGRKADREDKLKEIFFEEKQKSIKEYKEVFLDFYTALSDIYDYIFFEMENSSSIEIYAQTEDFYNLRRKAHKSIIYTTDQDYINALNNCILIMNDILRNPEKLKEKRDKMTVCYKELRNKIHYFINNPKVA